MRFMKFGWVSRRRISERFPEIFGAALSLAAGGERAGSGRQQARQKVILFRSYLVCRDFAEALKTGGALYYVMDKSPRRGLGEDKSQSRTEQSRAGRISINRVKSWTRIGTALRLT